VWQACHSISAAIAAPPPPAPAPADTAHDTRLLALTNACVTAVTQDMEQRRFNSAIAELMKLTNALTDASSSPSPSARAACARALLQVRCRTCHTSIPHFITCRPPRTPTPTTPPPPLIHPADDGTPCPPHLVRSLPHRRRPRLRARCCVAYCRAGEGGDASGGGAGQRQAEGCA